MHTPLHLLFSLTLIATSTAQDDQGELTFIGSVGLDETWPPTPMPVEYYIEEVSAGQERTVAPTIDIRAQAAALGRGDPPSKTPTLKPTYAPTNGDLGNDIGEVPLPGVDMDATGVNTPSPTVTPPVPAPVPVDDPVEDDPAASQPFEEIEAEQPSAGVVVSIWSGAFLGAVFGTAVLHLGLQ